MGWKGGRKKEKKKKTVSDDRLINCGWLTNFSTKPNQKTKKTYLAFRRRRQDPSTLQTFVARSWNHHKCTCGPSKEKYFETPCGLAVPARVLVPCTGRQVLFLLLFQRREDPFEAFPPLAVQIQASCPFQCAHVQSYHYRLKLNQTFVPGWETCA